MRSKRATQNGAKVRRSLVVSDKEACFYLNLVCKPLFGVQHV